MIDSGWTGGKTAGVVIGCIAFVAIVGAIAYYYRRKSLNTNRQGVTAVYRDGQVTNQYSFRNAVHESATINTGLAFSGSEVTMTNEQQGQKITVA